MRILDHPNLVKMESVYDYRVYIVIVLELFEGGTLADKIRNDEITTNDAVNYAQDILNALEYMHSENIVHRDIKSTNVMFHIEEGDNGKIEVLKIIDFGLCGDMEDQSENSLMHDKCGTLGYLAPELIAKKGKYYFYDGKVDVFSTGVLLYEM